MNRVLFLVAAATLLASLVPVGIATVRSPAIEGAAALALGGTVTALVLACLAVGLDQSSFAPLALIAAVGAVASGLVFARFLDRQP